MLDKKDEEELKKIILEKGLVSGIKFVRDTLNIRLVDSKKFVDGFCVKHKLTVGAPKDMVAEFLQDMDVYPSDYWNAIARMMVNNGWKK